MSNPKKISTQTLVVQGKPIQVEIVGDTSSQISKLIIASDQVRELVYWWIGRAITAPVRGVTSVLRNSVVFCVEEYEATITGIHKGQLDEQMQRGANVFNSFKDEILRVMSDEICPEDLKVMYIRNLKIRMQQRLDKMD